MAQEIRAGDVVWRDLTVGDAEKIGSFYEAVVGWQRSVHPGCDDFNLTPAGGDEPVAGVCFAKGSNADLPPQWLVWVAVDDVAAAAARVREHGGKILDGPRMMGNHSCCVLEDPAGAVLGLIATTPG